MKTKATEIRNLVEVEVVVARDERGSFQRLFDAVAFNAAGLFGPAVHVNLSHNPVRGTLRGLHYQDRPLPDAKIVSCVRGAIFDVVVDLRRHSPTYGRSHTTILEADDERSIVIPELCAHGFVTLEPHSTVHYVMSVPYVPEMARGIRWNDPHLAIPWPIQPILISAADANLPNSSTAT